MDKLINKNNLQVVVMRMTNLLIVNYSYLVIDSGSKKAVAVDPAWQIDKVDEALSNADAELSGILLTHAHPDHVHLAKPLSIKYRCPIWMSIEEIEASGYYVKQLNRIDQIPWSIGQMKIQPILTPGHTSGSTCYLVADNLFTGDTLFTEGCGICYDTSSAHRMFESLQRLKNQISPETRVFPGHSYGKLPGQKFAHLLKENIYLNFTNRDDFAAFRLRIFQKNYKVLDFGL